MSKPVKQIPGEKLELYARLVKTNPGAELKGASMPYTSVNGNMYSFFSSSGLGLRLPKESRESFLAKYDTTLYVTQGTILKEYVTVPDSLLQDTKALKKYFDMSFDYANTLKPKPTKKKS